MSQSVKVMMVLPQITLELLMLVWIISALRRTLSYLKMKRQDYKLSIMKRFALIFSIGVTIYILIRVAKMLFELS